MASKTTAHIIPAPPSASASAAAKATYYEKHDPADIVDAGYFEEDGLYQGNKLLIDLRPERGLVRVLVQAEVAHKLHRFAKKCGLSPSDLVSAWLSEDLAKRTAK